MLTSIPRCNNESVSPIKRYFSLKTCIFLWFNYFLINFEIHRVFISSLKFILSCNFRKWIGHPTFACACTYDCFITYYSIITCVNVPSLKWWKEHLITIDENKTELYIQRCNTQRRKWRLIWKHLTC